MAALAAIAGLFLLACASPGPVWLVITFNAIGAGRRAGVLAGLGVACATLIWASIAMAGLGLVLARMEWIGTTIRLAGAAYLVWIGWRMLRGAGSPPVAPGGLPRGGASAFRRGFLASITNPKAAAFFGSVFVVTLPEAAPDGLRLAAVLMLGALSAAWHAGLAVVFSTARVQAAYAASKRRLDLVVGVVLMGLGLRLAVAR
jgi:threonine/homoserine/homoserine lactone efflux protein